MEAGLEPSCEGWLPLLAPHLPASLIEPAALGRLGSLMACLPATVSGAIEIRLGAATGPVDLSVRVDHPGEARSIARRLPLGDVERFLLHWERQRDTNLPFVWLEFDLPETGAEPRAPLAIPRIGEQAPEGWLLDTLLPTLREEAPAAPQLATIRRALSGLPAGARCCYVFDLRPRGTEAIRLSFSGLAAAAMPERLEQLDRPDLARSLAPALPLVEGADRREINFDVDDKGAIEPRIGLEISYATWPGRDPRWPRLFDRLVEAGLCQPEKRDALLAWPGHDSRRTAPDLWPAPSALADSHLVRWISHVKLVCVPDQAIEAKVYLLFGLWTRGRDGRLKEGATGLEAAAGTAVA